jgi:tripartite-type tricarboxylate transporter receptor subunit TctC
VAGVQMVHVPYRGGGPVGTALLQAEVDMGMSDMSVFLAHHRAGTMRILAVGSAQRLPYLPDVPTLAESGITGVETSNWHGLVTAAGVPDAILDRLNAAAAASLRDPEVVKALNDQGIDPVGGSRAELAALIRADKARWAEVIRRANIRPE